MISQDANKKVGDAIPQLSSANPMDRKQAMEVLNDYDNASARDLAFYSVCAAVEKEIIPGIKIQMLSYLSQTAKNNPDKVKEILTKESKNPDESIKGTALMLMESLKSPPSTPAPTPPPTETEPSAEAKPETKQDPQPQPEPVKAEPPPPKPKKPQRPKFQKGTPEWQIVEQLKAYGTSHSNMMKMTMEQGISFAAKHGAIGPYLEVLLGVFDWGTDLEIMSACDLLGVIGKYNASGASSLGKALKHENPYVREKAAAALVKMGKNAAPAQAQLMEATEDMSPKVSKLAYKALKKFKKMSKEEKQRIKFIAQQEKELMELQKKSQQKMASAGNLKPKAASFDQYEHVFFMSHAVDDFPWVEKAVKEIESWPGCRCWICERDIKPGDDWMTEIYKGLSSSNWFLLFWSENSENSKWTREEMNEAKQKNIESGGTPRVSVINLGKDEWPALFARSQSAKVLSDQDMNSYLTNLKSQLGV